MRRRLRPLAGVVAVWCKALADFFLPERCVVCGGVLSRKEHYLCCRCEADLPLTFYWARERQPMSERYNARIQEQSVEYEDFGRAAALFFYREQAGYKGIPQALKYEGRRSLGRCFGRRLGRELARSPLFSDVDVVVPVPLHPLRRFKRGYNQAAVLAKAIAAAYASVRPLYFPGLVRRTRSTRTQTQLSGEEKAKNVAGAFRVNDRALARLPFSPRHILVVDDVFTSGATLAAVHNALRAVFPPEIRISVATLAFVLED
ncbi:MAG: ComF family protein [Bacteroidales bacterium]|nr:ComF family protein [Bacteroidales bacterium]